MMATNSLSGSCISAEDSGVTVADQRLIENETCYVAGTHANCHLDNGSTAYGVFVGLKASAYYALNIELKNIKVAIQGLGHVGMRLAALLHNEGAEQYVTDIHKEISKKL